MNYNDSYYPQITEEKIEQLVKEYKNYIRSGNWPNPRKRMVIANKNTQELIGTVFGISTVKKLIGNQLDLQFMMTS